MGAFSSKKELTNEKINAIIKESIKRSQFLGEAIMKCPNCYAENHHNNRVCSKCGALIASTPHEKYGDLRCPDCGSNELEIITLENGKVVDPNKKRSIFSKLKKKEITTVRKCKKCNREF